MLARAFHDDPAMAYLLPDPAPRPARLARLFAILFDSDAASGMRLITAGGEAMALWRAPGHAVSGAGAMFGAALPLLRVFGTALPRALRLSGAIEAHFPEQPFWYLHIAGCDHAHQGRGHGGAAVRAGLARAAGRLPAYLETANPANLGFYEGLGFAVTGEWRVAGDGPRFWSMLRPAG